MGFIVVVLKILLMLASVFVMFLPLLLEYLSYRRDCETGISHKRFRLMIFALLYCAVITVVMIFLQDLTARIGSWSWVSWLANKLTLSNRLSYGMEVFAVMVINLIIGLLFKPLIALVRIGLKKKDLTKPKENGEYSFAQKAERKVLTYFNDEKWFFAGTILKFLCLALVLVYTGVFLFYLLPVLFGADWIPYAFAIRLFEAGYIYPLLSLLPLCEAYFFLAGVENLEKECPDFDETAENGIVLGTTQQDIETVNDECKKLFKNHFVLEIEDVMEQEEIASTAYHQVTKLIAKGIESNSRNPKPIREGYLRCLNTIVENDIGPEDKPIGENIRGVLVNGSLFTDFSEYFLRYISVILSRGDNVLFVCNNNSQIEQTYQCVVQTLEKIYSLYHAEAGKQNISFDDPVWKVLKVDADSSKLESVSVNNCSVLVTDLNFLTTAYFEQQCDTFIHLVDTVVVVDTLGTVNNFSRQMSIFDTKVKNMREQNATRAKNSSKKGKFRADINKKDSFRVRYSSNQIKYICFDDSRIPGLDKVLKNLLFVNFVSADSMRYSPQTIISCYNYEGRINENGERDQIQHARIKEDLSVLVNMADYAAGLGSGKISLFAEQNMPFRDLSESIDANANHGLWIQNGVNLSINNHQYDLDDCRVIVAFDHNDNLPMAVRRFRTMTSDKKTLVMIFSRPYMFRDYYLANIEQLWKSEQLMRIPVEQTGKSGAIQKILVKANSGGIAVKEIFNILANAQLSDYADILQSRDIPSLFRKLLLDCGKHQNDTLNWNDYFEFVRFSDFNTRGEFVVEERVCLRNKRVLGSLLGSDSPASAVIDGKEYPLPIPKNRITQNYIVGQNLLYDGCVYVINAIDVANGKIFIKHATGGCNVVPYQYVQNREYHIDYSDPNPERAYPTKQVELNSDGEMTVKKATISVTKRPMEVITRGYSIVDQRTMAANDTENGNYFTIDGDEQIDKFRQTYRKYGEVKNPVCSSNVIMKRNIPYSTSPNGALVMSIKISGEFGVDNARMVLLASVMLNEVLRTMFPSVADAVVVCPVLNMEAFGDEESLEILKKLPKAYCREYSADAKDVELLIIEDCAADLGVISVLMSSGDDVLKMLFAPVYNYLSWYLKTDTPSDYLNFGMQEAPKCFDFESLSKLAAILGKDEFKMNFVDIESAMLYDVCDFCGKRYVKGTDVAVLEDGRKMCKDCASSLVANDKRVLKSHLERAKIFLESTYGITLGDDYEFCFESTVKIVNALKQNRELLSRGADVPLKSYIDGKKRVHVEYSIPSANLSELLVRELTHVWQLKHLPELEEDLAQGHIALVAIQYLRFLNQNSLASVRSTYYESTANLSGVGYRKLVSELLANSRFKNNPFLYLLQRSGSGTEQAVLPTPTPRVIEAGDYGLPYTPTNHDRAPDGKITYFYYERLTATQQRAYNALLDAIRAHQSQLTVEGGGSVDMQKVSYAVAYDHPELFWYNGLSMDGNTAELIYGTNAEEAVVLQKRMDEVIPKYLEGIDDSMSAYDVALRLHVKVIDAVDYDTIALNREEKAGGPARDKIDYLRTICGVFLNGKAVCEGYARAMQYLLQKCGVECAEAAGYIRNENGERDDDAHAWNILKIDGDYYYLDTTWDDSSNTIQTVKSVDLGFDYFAITTEELCRTRYVDLCPTEMPICNATRGNYYYHNDFVLTDYDLTKIKTIAQTAAKSKSGFFSFKCTTIELMESALEQMCSVGQDCCDVLKAASKVDKRILDNTYRFTYDRDIRTITIYFKYEQ